MADAEEFGQETAGERTLGLSAGTTVSEWNTNYRHD